MASPQITLRQAMSTELELKKLNSDFSLNTFNVEETYLPYEDLLGLKTRHPGGKLYLITMAVDEGDNRTRHPNALALREIPIGVGFQIADIKPTDTDKIDETMELVNEFYEFFRHFQLEGFAWLRTVSLKDENGVPYQYTALRQNNLLEAYFTVYYNYVVH